MNKFDTTNNNTYRLFTIRQAAHACSLSRASLLRLEKKGLLTPAYTNPDTGYRWYDNDNIARILQIQKFQCMGFSQKEISYYYESKGMADNILASMKEKLSLLQQQVEEMRIRAQDVPDMTINIVKIPETVCCIHSFKGISYQNKYDAIYSFFHECVEKGYVLAPKPLFFINERTDYLEGRISSEPYNFHACVPVLPEQAPEDAVRIPACTALSVLVYDAMNRADDAYLYLGEKVRENSLTPAGFVRGIALVAPYVGREIDSKMYCTQLVLPVEGDVYGKL